MDYKEIFSKRLVELREARNITQQELADKLQITRQSLSLYEKAERTINIELLARIADFFNVSTDYLMGRTEISTMNKDIQNACETTGLSEQAVCNLKKISDEKDSVLNVVNFLLEQEEVKSKDRVYFSDCDHGVFKATLFDYLTSLLLLNVNNDDLLSNFPENIIGILENGIITDHYNIYYNGNKKILDIDLVSVIEESIFQKIKNQLVYIKELMKKEAENNGEHHTEEE